VTNEFNSNIIGGKMKLPLKGIKVLDMTRILAG
jgi:crotonobetainyl-CoA:carnitine CoA-transferase CaiB-like acyl-CoA transferase